MSQFRSFVEFQHHFRSIAIEFEYHRQRCKNYAYLGILVALILFALVLFVPDSWGTSILLLLPLLPVILFCIFWPVMMYRGNNARAGLAASKLTDNQYEALDTLSEPGLLKPLEKKFGKHGDAHRHSLKDAIYSRLTEFFGDFHFAPSGGIPLSDIRNASILPAYDHFVTEDYILGSMNEMTVKMSEARLMRVVNGKKLAVFHGVMVLIDICETSEKLRGNFSGRTVVISDSRKEQQEIVQKYGELKRYLLPTGELEQQYEAYTSDEKEAAGLITQELFTHVNALYEKLLCAQMQIEHWDAKLEKLINRLLGRTKATTPDAIVYDNTAINERVQVEFYDDKVLITVPCPYDLFEPNSIFEPALVGEDADILYEIMRVVHDLSLIVKHYLDSRNHG